MNRFFPDTVQHLARRCRTASAIAPTTPGTALTVLALATMSAMAHAESPDLAAVATRFQAPPPSVSIDATAEQPSVDRTRGVVEDAIRNEEGDGVERDLVRAYALYCEAARLGSPEALMRMGWMYMNGRGRPHDEAVAQTLFRRAAGAPAGYDDRMPDCLRPPYRIVEYREPEPKIESAPVGRPGVPVLQRPAEFFAANPSAERSKLVRTAVKMAGDFELDPRLILALIRTESNFDPQAVSPKNAQGLMQLIPETAERFAVQNPFDPVQNLRGGMRYLRWLLSYFRGDVMLALAGYNAGEGAVDRYRGVPPFTETRAYVERIRALFPYDRHPFDATLASPAPWVSESRRLPRRTALGDRTLVPKQAGASEQALVRGQAIDREDAIAPVHTNVSLRKDVASPRRR